MTESRAPYVGASVLFTDADGKPRPALILSLEPPDPRERVRLRVFRSSFVDATQVTHVGSQDVELAASYAPSPRPNHWTWHAAD